MQLPQPMSAGRLVHAAGIGGVGGDEFAAVKLNVGQKPLVSAHQAAGGHRLGQLHKTSLSTD